MAKKLTLLLFLKVICILSINAQISFPLASSFSYAKGNDAVISDWNATKQAPTGWLTGNAPFWYGDGSDGTTMNDMQNSYSTFYLHSTFKAQNVDRLSSLKFTFDYDDGFVLYINGQVVLDRNAPELKDYNSFAPSNHESGNYTTLYLDRELCNLVEGDNVMAVQVFNVSLTSSDVFFDVAIEADVEKPEMADSLLVGISQDAGFYEQIFGVVLTSPIDDYRIMYTLDGSNPQNSVTAKEYDKNGSLLIDPSSVVDRPKTPAVVLRACLATDSLKSGTVTTRTYIFPNEVSSQSTPSAPWPSGMVNDQEIIYDVSADIANDSRYKNEFVSSLKAISTLSIVTDAAHLFDASSGIYVNAMEDGIEWERPCSFELINPDGSEGFEIGAGVRMRGGWSRHGYFPKHSFRMFFRNEYGAGKLKYPLFEDEGADEFDKIDLRTSQNYSWSTGQDHNTMLRDVFSRDLQGDMAQPYTRSRYYHLYINGMYWGIYQTQERAEANFAQTYLGGDTEDYDVVKANRVDGVLQTTCTDGTIDSWENIWNQISSSMADNDKYFKLLGCDEEGVQDPALERWVDVENLIDYMNIIFYTGNYDAPTSKYGKNVRPNNYYGIYNRDNPLIGFKFFAHDCEHTLFYDKVASNNPGIGIQENRVNLHTLDDDYRLNVIDFKNFNPQWLHARLTENKEYCVQFADRAYKHYSANGVLNESAHTTRMQERIEELEDAMISESLRWGGASHSPAYTVDDDWRPEVTSIIEKYFPERGDIVIQQLKDAGLYPSIDWPSVNIDDEMFTAERYEYKDRAEVLLVAPSGANLAYTLDGTDPRFVGGGLNTTSETTNGAIFLDITQATHIAMRAYNGTEWSALRHLYVSPEQGDWDNLKITELHYHPADTLAGNDTVGSDKFEFVELKNIHPTKAINIGGLKFDDGIKYEFPDNYILQAQEFYVIASSAYKFYQRYGQLPSGDFSKNFSNGGENVRILLPNDSVFAEFYYMDEAPWIADADGFGSSMVSYETNPISYTPELPVYWWASAEPGGSPFADDIASKTTVLSNEEIQSDISPVIQLFPNPSRGAVTVGVSGLSIDKMLEVELCSLTGQCLCATSLTNYSGISLSSLDIVEGVYIVNVRVDNQTYVTKLLYHP